VEHRRGGEQGDPFSVPGHFLGVRSFSRCQVIFWVLEMMKTSTLGTENKCWHPEPMAARRSVVLFQRLLGTSEIMLVHHTNCGMLKFTDAGLSSDIESKTGVRPPFVLGAFTNLAEDVPLSMTRLNESPFSSTSRSGDLSTPSKPDVSKRLPERVVEGRRRQVARPR
jgi:hypothetical protein